MKITNKIYIVLTFLLWCCTGCEKKSSIEDNSILPQKEAEIDGQFELSYWIDIDVRHNNGRGYWFNVETKPEDLVPSEQEIKNSCEGLAKLYKGDKLYVTYHRQFEIEKAKQVLINWKKYGKDYGLNIVPTIVLESYATPSKLNFSNIELVAFSKWCKDNINESELGIYDVYVRQSLGSVQDVQLKEIKSNTNLDLVRVGVQPGEKMNSYFNSGVQDTWTAECQGITNELWENPRYYKGTNRYGRRLLKDWVDERIEGESRKIIWDLIPVAWDYDAPLDPFGYIFPGDDALINDPPIPGRLKLSKDYILSLYQEGTSNRLFGGFSCDLHILEANSAGRPESPTFYEQLRNGQPYKGYFSTAMDEVGMVYGSFNKK